MKNMTTILATGLACILFTITAGCASTEPCSSDAPENTVTTSVWIDPRGLWPVHKYPYKRYVCVFSGCLRVIREDGRSSDLKPGACLVESANTLYAGENISDKPMHLVVVDHTNIPPRFYPATVVQD